jgi:protein gp37
MQEGTWTMSERINWDDCTVSPWTVCTPVSEGCRNCYARTLARRYWWSQDWGAGVPRHRFSGFERSVLAMERKAAEGWFLECTACGWRGYIRKNGEGIGACGCHAKHPFESNLVIARPRVFPSLCDWLDPEVPVEWLADLLDVVRRTPSLAWLLLTKRPGLWRERMNAAHEELDKYRSPHAMFPTLCMVNAWLCGDASRLVPPNVWIGATCEDQAAADERVPELLRIPARVRFLSCEPMLGPVEFSNVTRRSDCVAQLGKRALDGINWVVCGGERGPNARPMHPDWARSLRDQCEAAGVAFNFKQWGEWAPTSTAIGSGRNDRAVVGVTMMSRVGKARAGRMLDGREHNVTPREGGL